MNLAVIGIGLIGGSLAITLKENGYARHIVGVDAVPENIDKALRRRLIDEGQELTAAMAGSDLIVLATPVDVMLSLLPAILDQIADHQIVIDVGSTKEQLLRTVQHHPRRGRFVACHPMAGTEYSGPEAAVPNLFDGKAVVFCETERSDPDALAEVQRLFASIPMQPVTLGAKEHDLHTAYVSHISHISSFALALTVLEKEKDEDRIFQLASGGFSSTVRLAKSSPDMWAPIFRQNRDHLLDVLDEHINQLARFRSLLIKNDFEGMHRLMREANLIKKIIS